MNNAPIPVHLIISNRFKMHTDAFNKELRSQVVKQLEKMGRLFSDKEYEIAVQDISYLRFTMSGVDFSVFRK